MWVQSLVGEVRSHIPFGQSQNIKQKQYCNKTDNLKIVHTKKLKENFLKKSLKRNRYSCRYSHYINMCRKVYVFMSYPLSSTFPTVFKTGLCTEEMFSKYTLINKMRVSSLFAVYVFELMKL